MLVWNTMVKPLWIINIPFIKNVGQGGETGFVQVGGGG
jgi:hypothetical protein